MKTKKSVGYLGPEGSFSHKIALKISAKEHLPFQTITKVMEAFWNKKMQEIVLPIENSIEGVVTPTIDNLISNREERFSINAEYILKIQQNLIGIGIISQIQKIISHPQALAQCKGLIESLNVETENCSSTSAAVKMVKEKNNPYLAALGSKLSAKIYGLEIIKPNVQDSLNNKTRFIILRHGDIKSIKNDKTSIIFGLKNKYGALSKVLSLLEAEKINITFIMSRPSKNELGEYNFFIDLDCNGKKEGIIKAIKKIKNQTIFIKHLGFYRTY